MIEEPNDQKLHKSATKDKLRGLDGVNGGDCWGEDIVQRKLNNYHFNWHIDCGWWYSQ